MKDSSIDPACDRAFGAATAAEPSEPLMWLNTDRVLYVGLLGAPSMRTFGAYSLYLSLARPHRICVEGGRWEEASLSVVPPYVPHRIVSVDRMICNVLVEADTVSAADLCGVLRAGRGAIHDPQAVQSLREALLRFRLGSTRRYASTADFDRAFFGAALPARPVDRRIAQVLARIKDDPNRHFPAEDCAASCHLSVSRFLHLFRAEVEAPFRSFRTWQRARSLLYFVTRNSNLAAIALDVGYPDSTHFSHSIRQIYGLTPKSIFAGCRRLALYGSGAAALPRFAFH